MGPPGGFALGDKQMNSHCSPALPLAPTAIYPGVAFDAAVKQRIYHQLRVLGLALQLGYLIALPSGLNGLALTLLGLTAIAVTTSRETFGFFCLLMGPALTGVVLRSFGVPGVGAPGSLLLGILLLYGFRRCGPSAAGRWRAPVLWLLLTVAVLSIAYLLGPRSDYCRGKLTLFVAGLVIDMCALTALVGTAAIDCWTAGLLAIAASAVHYSTTAYNWPGVMPSNIFVPCGLRVTDPELITEAWPAYAGALACFGMMCLVGSAVNKRLDKPKWLQMGLATATGLLIINSVGQRLYIITLVLAAGLLLLCRPADRVFARAIMAAVVLWCAGAAAVGFAKGATQFVQTFTPEQSPLPERLNRSLNWDCAVSLIKEKPLLGHGLGGYYLGEPGIYSEPGSGAYAHNVFLEFLSETGIIGTALVVGPLVTCFFIPAGRRLLQFRTPAGFAPVFLLLYAICSAMITGDLRQSHLLFAILAVLWAHITPGRTLPLPKLHPAQAGLSVIVGRGLPCRNLLRVGYEHRARR
jgi:O-antigen ligase